jgi:hypothetical protein
VVRIFALVTGLRMGLLRFIRSEAYRRLVVAITLALISRMTVSRHSSEQ